MEAIKDILQNIKPEPTKSQPILLDRSEDKELIITVGLSFCSDFSIEGQEDFYFGLLDYFMEREGQYDLNKGLLIGGDIGTGKTMAMKIFQKMKRNFQIVTTRHVVRDFFTSPKPSEIIDLYGRNSFYKNTAGLLDKSKPKTICFDDFGLENVAVKNYGNEQNILEEIMLDRYEAALSIGMKTFITTNLNVDMIEQNYGKRVRDRFRETMNLINLTGKSKRK